MAIRPIDRELIQGAAQGFRREVHYALLHGANPDVCDIDGTPVLSIAAVTNFAGTCKEIYKYNPNIEQKDTDGDTPIMNAIIAEAAESTQFLWEKGASLDEKNNCDETGRDLMEDSESPEIQWLYKQILRWEETHQPDEPRPHLSAWNSSYEDEEEMDERVAARAKLSEDEQMDLDQELFQAVLAGDAQHVLECLEDGANPNIEDERGNSPLMWAAKFGYTEIAIHLLRGGADPDHVNYDDERALTEAIKGGHVKCARAIKRFMPSISSEMRAAAEEAGSVAYSRGFSHASDYANRLVYSL